MDLYDISSTDGNNVYVSGGDFLNTEGVLLKGDKTGFHILKEGKTYYCIGAKGMWFDPRLKFFRMKFDRERKKSNIQFKHIFDEEVKTKSPEPLQFEKNRYKFLPKKYCSNLTIEFFGDYTVIYTGEDYGKLKEKPTLFVLKSKEIADGFKKLFQFMWDKSS